MTGKILRINGTRYIAFPLDVLKRKHPELCESVEIVQSERFGNSYSDKINQLDDMNRRDMRNWEDRGDDFA